MANNVTNLTKVITGTRTRWSYVNAWDPKSINGGTPKYSVSLIIPKDDVVTVNKNIVIDARKGKVPILIDVGYIAVFNFLLLETSSNVKNAPSVSPKNAIILAYLQIFHYLCTDIQPIRLI